MRLLPLLACYFLLATGQSELIGVHAAGIDECAGVCNHEKMHEFIREVMITMGPDSDGDMVPDAYETATCYPGGINLQEDERDTYWLELYFPDVPTYAWFGDEEFLARLAERDDRPVVPALDWSDTNGKNWSN